MEANTGTKPVAESHAFDLGVLQAFLEAKLEGFEGPLTVEQFKGGQIGRASCRERVWCLV